MHFYTRHSNRTYRCTIDRWTVCNQSRHILKGATLIVHRIPSGFRLTTRALFFVLLVGGLLAVSQAKSADEQSETDFSSATRRQRVFTCGHSFHVFVHRLVGEMAKAAGIQDHESVGISRIGDSRVIQHWDVPEEKNEAKAALRLGQVDVLTLVHSKPT